MTISLDLLSVLCILILFFPPSFDINAYFATTPDNILKDIEFCYRIGAPFLDARHRWVRISFETTMCAMSAGTVPGPLLMGVIFDSTCMLWQNDCGSAGSCMFYDNTSLSLRFLSLSLGVAGVGLVAMIVGTVCYRAPVDTDSIMIRINGGAGGKSGEATEMFRRTC